MEKKKKKGSTATRGNLDDANDAGEAWGGWWGGGVSSQHGSDSLNGSIAVAITADCRGVTLNFPLLFYIFGLRSFIPFNAIPNSFISSFVT